MAASDGVGPPRGSGVQRKLLGGNSRGRDVHGRRPTPSTTGRGVNGRNAGKGARNSREPERAITKGRTDDWRYGDSRDETGYKQRMADLYQTVSPDPAGTADRLPLYR